MGKKGGGESGNKAAWQVTAVMEGKTPPSYYIICRYQSTSLFTQTSPPYQIFKTFQVKVLLFEIHNTDIKKKNLLNSYFLTAKNIFFNFQLKIVGINIDTTSHKLKSLCQGYFVKIVLIYM